MKAWGSRWEEEREKAFFSFLSSPMWLLFFIYFNLLFLLGGPSRSLCGTDSTNQAYKGALTCCAVVNCVVYSHWVSRVIYTVHSYTNAIQKYLNSSLFQIHEMCLNKLIIIKIFCRHNNLMPVEARSTFASTSFFLFLSVFLHFLSEQHVFISTCHS